MNADVLLGLSPDQLYESFNEVRRHFADQFEAEFAQGQDSELRAAWLEKRPKELDRQLFKTLGLTLEAIEQQVAEEGKEYKAHHELVGQRDVLSSPDPHFGLPVVPSANSSAAFPYATVVLGQTEEAIEAFGGEASGNPDAWKLAGFSARQEFFLERWGSGTGFYDFSLIPEYNSHDFLAVQWYFIHMPFGDGEWSCSAKPWFHGAYDVWSDDHFLTSRYASVEMTARICLLPFGIPVPRYHDMQCSSDTVIDEGGPNIDKARWGGWVPTLAKLSPYPVHRQKPHWIIVTVNGQATVRGYAHAKLDFAKLYTSSGSGMSYRETKYGIYCHTATIHW